MNTNIIIFLLVMLATLSYGQKIPVEISETDFSIGKTLAIESFELNETRDINIYLPANYSDDSLKLYPVIYLLDGGEYEDFIHIVGIVQFGSFPWVNMVPESIVVGIANVDRKRDFTSPSQNKLDQNEFPTSGKSENFISFLEKELLPFITSKYRISEEQTIIGQSLGGLLATEILFKKPGLFDNYIIVSPSLWWNDEKLLEADIAHFDSPKTIYVAGGKEGEVMERTAKELFTKLEDHKTENTTIIYEFFEDKTHGNALHIAVYKAFEQIFASK